MLYHVLFRVSPKYRLAVYESLMSSLAPDISLGARPPSQKLSNSPLQNGLVSQVLTQYSHTGYITGGLSNLGCPPAELMLIDAGERLGNVRSGLSEAAVMTKASGEISRAIFAGVAFPALLLSVLGVLAFKMLPVL